MSIVAMFFSSNAGEGARATLSLFRCPLGCLQRINRCRAGKSAALSRRMLRLSDHQIPAIRPWHGAFNYQQIVVLLHAEDAQIAHGYTRVAHVSRHPHAFEDSRWKR